MLAVSDASKPKAWPIDPLVSVEWLAEHRASVKILDGTWVLPSDAKKLAKGYIPGARLFDLDAVADQETNLKHMLPSAEVFSDAVGRMGIKSDDVVVCYDRHGVFSSPRLWWTFKMFGHERVYVLDGGLPAWIKAGHTVERAPAATTPDPVLYTSDAPLQKVVTQSFVKNAIGKTQTVDARPTGRFEGTSPEPRANLRSGHIPRSQSLPFGSLRTADGYFKPLAELKDRVHAANIDLTKPIITSCGSGITAAGLAFTFHRLGAQDISVYDGSWAEWGAGTSPVTNPAKPINSTGSQS